MLNENRALADMADGPDLLRGGQGSYGLCVPSVGRPGYAGTEGDVGGERDGAAGRRAAGAEGSGAEGRGGGGLGGGERRGGGIWGGRRGGAGEAVVRVGC